jgi:hypothetical protein
MATVTTTRGRRAPKRPLKSPLAVHGGYSAPSPAPAPDDDVPVPEGTALREREATLTEFEDHLRTGTSKKTGRPFEEGTINAYVSPGKSLDSWLTAKGIDGDFTLVDTRTLNRYFREYYLDHGQGGTHTLQRNLIQLFSYLERERGNPTPYNDSLNRYAEVKGRPKTLSASFVDDLLEVTGGGKARDFETARDHAIIRILRSEGIRRQEVLSMVMHTLSADVIKNPVSASSRSRGRGQWGRGGWCPSRRPPPASWPSISGHGGSIARPIRTGYGSAPAGVASCRTPASGLCSTAGPSRPGTQG